MKIEKRIDLYNHLTRKKIEYNNKKEKFFLDYIL